MGFLLRICFRVWKCRTEKRERNWRQPAGCRFLVKKPALPEAASQREETVRHLCHSLPVFLRINILQFINGRSRDRFYRVRMLLNDEITSLFRRKSFQILKEGSRKNDRGSGKRFVTGAPYKIRMIFGTQKQ